MRISLVLKSKGFTLIELLIAVTIIGILAAAVSIGYVAHLRNARCSRILQDFDAIGKAAETQYEVTGVWARDVDPNPTQTPIPTPAFVPEYMPTWPSGDFYEDNAYYDWENWPVHDPPQPGDGVYKAISFRIPPIAPGGKTYFYCVQDDSTPPDSDPTNDCAWTTAAPPPALNRGGTCP